MILASIPHDKEDETSMSFVGFQVFADRRRLELGHNKATCAKGVELKIITATTGNSADFCGSRDTQPAIRWRDLIMLSD